MTRPATFKCFDCGYEAKAPAETASFVATCPKCEERDLPGMMLVFTLDGEPVNRGYFPQLESADKAGSGK